MTVNCKMLARLHLFGITKEVEISGDCEELGKRLNELTLLEKEVFKKEAEILSQSISTGVKRLLGSMKSRLMRRGP